MYFVLNKTAKMPRKIKAPYRKIAVVKADTCPHAIDARVCEIVKLWDHQHLGFRPQGNTAAELALREAEALAEQLNAEALAAAGEA